jgi:hypothetical protein
MRTSENFPSETAQKVWTAPIRRLLKPRIGAKRAEIAAECQRSLPFRHQATFWTVSPRTPVNKDKKKGGTFQSSLPQAPSRLLPALP